MKQITAIEWLIDQLIPKDQHEGIMDIIQEAKEMEKQQIMDAFNSGENSDDYFLPSLKLKECEVYYNETYNSK